MTDDKIDNTFEFVFFPSNNIIKTSTTATKRKEAKKETKIVYVTKQMFSFYRLMPITCGLNTNKNSMLRIK